jgi:hypothetical protein
LLLEVGDPLVEIGGTSGGMDACSGVAARWDALAAEYARETPDQQAEADEDECYRDYVQPRTS